MSARLLWPDLEPEHEAEGWLPDVPTLTAAQVLDACAKRHPMDGYGAPARWVFAREVQAATGHYSSVQRFDGVAIGLVPSVKYARVVYEVKVSRADWLRELKPIPDVRWRDKQMDARTARRVAKYAAEEADGVEVPIGSIYTLAGTYNKWDEALAVSTEFWYAAPPRCILVEELPPEAGLVEVRLWGQDREPRGRIVRKAQVRDTPNPGPEFWASILRRAARWKDDAA